MDRRALLVALPLLAAAPALAAEEKSDPKDVGQYVDLASVAVPIVVSGQLVNYVFISVRVVLTSSANTPKMRAKEPYFRDALIRAAHRTPFTNPNDYLVIDGPRLQSTMLREARAIGGADNIKSITIVSQTPKRRIGLPDPRNVARAGEIRP